MRRRIRGRQIKNSDNCVEKQPLYDVLMDQVLDNIEPQVSSAEEHVHSGTEVLKQPKSLQKSSRKWNVH